MAVHNAKMAHSLWNRNQKMGCVLGFSLRFRSSKATLAKATPFKGAEVRVSNSSIADINGDVRRVCKQGELNEAGDVLYVMEQQGIGVDASTYSSLLQECVNKKDLAIGRLIHGHMIHTGLSPGVFLGTKLIIMYGSCGSLTDARRVLDEMPERNVVSWTALIAAYARHGRDREALKLFYQMQLTDIQPNRFTFSSVLSACANLAALEHGKKVHEDIIRSGFRPDVFVERTLLNMYVKCGAIEDANKVFDRMSERNVVSWTAMITGYAQNGHIDEALKLFQKLPEQNVVSWNSMIAGYAQNGYVHKALKLFLEMPERDVVSWNAMIVSYTQNGYVDEARKLFLQMPERNLISWTAMIAGYAQDGLVEEGLKLFQKMPERDVVSWNAMIAGYGKSGCFNEALKLYGKMQRTCLKPNSVTFASVLPACANLAALEYGKEIHDDIIRCGFQSDAFVGYALVDMYAKCGRMEDAQNVFDQMPKRDVATWTTLIAGYAQNGHVDNARNLFQKMQERDVVSWNAIIAGYAQNGHVNEAMKLFQKMPERDVVSWNGMMSGYVQNMHFNEALKLCQRMKLTAVEPNSITFASVLPACANMAAMEYGKVVHKDIIISGFQADLFVGDALVDMYAKCGSMENANKVFDKMPERNVVSWTSMIVGYAMHGCGKEAVQLFEQMQYSGIKPNHVTFVGVLSACCHAGLVDDGWQYFNRMNREYHITPAMEHYCCIVDLLGRAGHLDDAEYFISKMPIKPNAVVWGSLLSACRNHTNIELGERVAERLFELDPKNASHYVLLSNIYAVAGRWDDVEKVRNLMKDRRANKRPGCSWIEVRDKVYAFVVGDRSHPQTPEIYALLERLSGQMKEAGYMPDTNFVLYDVELQQKEYILCHHSEKLAIAFGLMHTSHGTSIRIVKNLRVCGDCHSAIKVISKIVAREIIVRDANRFHHFKNGQCSCGDYW